MSVMWHLFDSWLLQCRWIWAAVMWNRMKGVLKSRWRQFTFLTAASGSEMWKLWDTSVAFQLDVKLNLTDALSICRFFLPLLTLLLYSSRSTPESIGQQPVVTWCHLQWTWLARPPGDSEFLEGETSRRP